jgi:hypothetical protein
LPKVRSAKTAPELAGKIDRELFNQLLTVISSGFPPLFILIIHGNGNEARVEHFWLCGPCSSEYEFVFEPDGSVSLKHRPGARSALGAA